MPLYALVTQVQPDIHILCIHFIDETPTHVFVFHVYFQMGTNYKAAIIPQRIRETIHGWGEAARRRRRLGMYNDGSTIRTETSTAVSLEEDDHQTLGCPADDANTHNGIEVQPVSSSPASPCPVDNETSSTPFTPLLQPSASISSSSVTLTIQTEGIQRSASMPARRE